MEEIKKLLTNIKDSLISIKEEQKRANDLKEVELGIKTEVLYKAERLLKKDKK